MIAKFLFRPRKISVNSGLGLGLGLDWFKHVCVFLIQDVGRGPAEHNMSHRFGVMLSTATKGQ